MALFLFLTQNPPTIYVHGRTIPLRTLRTLQTHRSRHVRRYQACLMGCWSSVMILIMFVMFILSGILLLIITLWADFCADNWAALISILPEKNFVYDTVYYYAYCPQYEDAQRATDFPFNEFILPAKEALDLAKETVGSLSTTVASLGDPACTAEVTAISTKFDDVYKLMFNAELTDTNPYGLFTADGPIGCGALNGHLNTVLALTCNDLYNPLSRAFEFFFVIGWLILFSEMATKCLKVGQEANIDDYTNDKYDGGDDDQDGQKGVEDTGL